MKVMKRVRCRGSALEACVTRHGTLVGPLMTELVGFKELTPYKGGWCGNEVFADAFPQNVRDFARRSAFKIGDALRRRRYRGYFELEAVKAVHDQKRCRAALQGGAHGDDRRGERLATGVERGDPEKVQ